MSVSVLNQECQCSTLDEAALQAVWEAEIGTGDASAFFAPYAVFLSAAQVQALQAAVAALHRVLQLPAFADAGRAALGKRVAPAGSHGVFMGYDFHLEGDTPRLIEINTNAGGAFLNAVLLAHQQLCCEEVRGSFPGSSAGHTATQDFLAMFRSEWRLAGREGEPQRVLIVDDAPEAQFLYPEFLQAQRLLREAGWQVDIADPGELAWGAGELRWQGERVDMVYNRLTDFSLAAPAHAALRAAWEADACVLTPDPWHHAQQADKRHLVRLSDTDWLAAAGASAADRDFLARMVPVTKLLTPATAEMLWAARREYFFKPAQGFGSRAAYRGDKLTRGKWQEIVAAGDYVAQHYAPPGLRRVKVGESLRDMKFDVRCYAYDGRVLLMAARVYEGQTTNMRTPGGGFAPVFSPGLEALRS